MDTYPPPTTQGDFKAGFKDWQSRWAKFRHRNLDRTDLEDIKVANMPEFLLSSFQWHHRNGLGDEKVAELISVFAGDAV